MSSHATRIADALRTLHRVHKQLTDLKDRLQRGPRMVRARQNTLKKLEEQLVALQQQAKRLKFEIDEKNNQLASREANLERRRRQLQEASSNVEYQALKEQIASDEAANDVLEVEILDRMERQDQLQAEISQTEEAIGKARVELERITQQVEQENPLIQADIARLDAELTRCENSLPGEFSQLYRRVVRAKGEEALAAIQGEFCGGCNQHVPVNDINALMLGEARTCRSCGRLLYLPEDHSA
ncbi:MAG TPA: phospholipase [Planctomycetaceae bacterium]|nr:phospholipase [Planctomycetaceae bacterium]